MTPEVDLRLPPVCLCTPLLIYPIHTDNKNKGKTRPQWEWEWEWVEGGQPWVELSLALECDDAEAFVPWD